MNQLPLFGVQEGPEGLEYFPDFISQVEEKALLAHIARLPLAPFQFGQYEGKRRVIYFGSRYDFTHQKLARADPVPDWLSRTVSRSEVQAGLSSGSIAHALITEYQPGAGIGWHRDKKNFEFVLGVSLGAACPFRFRKRSGAKWQRFTIILEPRSLYVMSGEVRHEWEHSIAPVASQRFSITLRTMAETVQGGASHP